MGLDSCLRGNNLTSCIPLSVYGEGELFLENPPLQSPSFSKGGGGKMGVSVIFHPALLTGNWTSVTYLDESLVS